MNFYDSVFELHISKTVNVKILNDKMVNVKMVIVKMLAAKMVTVTESHYVGLVK